MQLVNKVQFSTAIVCTCLTLISLTLSLLSSAIHLCHIQVPSPRLVANQFHYSTPAWEKSWIHTFPNFMYVNVMSTTRIWTMLSDFSFGSITLPPHQVLQHIVSASGHPSKYYPSSMLLSLFVSSLSSWTETTLILSPLFYFLSWLPWLWSFLPCLTNKLIQFFSFCTIPPTFYSTYYPFFLLCDFPTFIFFFFFCFITSVIMFYLVCSLWLIISIDLCMLSHKFSCLITKLALYIDYILHGESPLAKVFLFLYLH